jgi:hypothetical protein
MELSVERVDVWAATIDDKPGGLGKVLSVLRDAGVDLQFVVARRTPEAPGKGVVFVAPLQGDSAIRAATQVGFSVTPSLHSIRVMGLDQLGIIAQLTQMLADGGINLRGVSAAVLGTQFIAYLAVDSLRDAEEAMDILQRA